MLLFATTTGYQTRAFGAAAERLGVELAFATDRCDQIDDPWQDGAIPIRFHEEDRSVAAIVEESRARPIDGVLVVGDRPTAIAARVAQALGLPWHPPYAVAAAKNKVLARERFRAVGLSTPWFVPLALSPDRIGSLDSPSLGPAIGFPCVVKPLALSASRGVMRADDDASLAAAVHRLRGLMSSPDLRAERNPAHEYGLIEEFIPGREYAVEAVLHHGELKVLTIFDKPDPLDGPFFEETIYVTPSRAPEAEQAAIVETIGRAAAALGLHHGPVHAECRVRPAASSMPESPEETAARVYVLEVAARPIGGLCAQALRFELDGGEPAPLEEMLLRHALGGAPPSCWRLEPGASGVMMIPIPRRGTYRSVDGVDSASAVPHVSSIQITAKPDQLLVPLPEGASYLGFIFARADAPADVEAALRAAHAALRFRIDTEFPVLGAGPVHYNHVHG
ncbi:MAG TPA: ATP-grasp domain-containing protein [Vicinamibacterales bacterium]